MVDHIDESNLDGAPPQVDDGWWESVLTDVESHAEVEAFGILEKNCTGDEGDAIDNVDWEKARELYKTDQVISLAVTGFNRGGLLVDGDDLKGFVPVSHLLTYEAESDKREREVCLAAYIGRDLPLKVIECDHTRGRVVFSERAAQADSGSRLALLDILKIGSTVHGCVTTVTDFGVFVDLGGIEGLIHISELSWGRVRHPGDLIKVGEQVTASVIQLDRERSRVALSIKRLLDNPWVTAGERYKPGEVYDALVTSTVSYGVFARLMDGLDGLIHVSELADTGFAEDPRDQFSEGETIKVRILHLDTEHQRLGLSLYTDI